MNTTAGEARSVVTEKDIDPDFVNELNALRHRRSIASCIHCGTCTGVCVVQDIHPEYNIRRMLSKAALGLKEELLSSEDIWLCVHCYSCVSRCPREVGPGERVADLQGMALRRMMDNQGARHAQAYIDSILKIGVINEAKVTLRSIGIMGMMGQGTLLIKLVMKGKVPHYFKKGIKGMDKLKPVIQNILEGKA